MSKIMNRIKQLFAVAIGVALMSLSFLPNAVYADGSTNENSCGGVNTAILDCAEEGSGGVGHILLLVVDIMSIGIGILAVVGITIVGIQYMGAKGDEAKTTKSKRRMYEIIIGVVCYVVLWGGLRWLLPNSENSLDSVLESQSQTSQSNTVEPNSNPANGNSNQTNSLNGWSGNTPSNNSNTNGTTNPGNNQSSSSQGGSQNTASNNSSGTQGGSQNTTSNGANSNQNNVPLAIDGSPTTGSMKNTKYSGKESVRSDTASIIKLHNKDFNYKNYKSKIQSFGGYEKYVNDLGGVFTDLGGYNRIPVKTAADLQAAAEYVFGLFMIWGPDYGSGKVHVNWDGKDAFYKGQPGRSSKMSYDGDKINKILKSSNKVRTCCNIAINTFNKSTVLSDHRTKRDNRKKTKWTELRVGDIIDFFDSAGKWHHVVMVGEVYDDYLVMYDGGSRFMRNRNYKFKMPRKNDSKLRAPYNTYASWKRFRPWNIDQNITLEGLN